MEGLTGSIVAAARALGAGATGARTIGKRAERAGSPSPEAGSGYSGADFAHRTAGCADGMPNFGASAAAFHSAA